MPKHKEPEPQPAPEPEPESEPESDIGKFFLHLFIFRGVYKKVPGNFMFQI